MMDDIDRAQARELADRELAMRQHAGHAPELPAMGICHYCGSSVAAGHRFCDADCRDGWDNEQAAMRRCGWRA